ncbi:MAG: NADH-quinone oxidoreductase subunit G, partial [Nocardioides kribbensis]
ERTTSAPGSARDTPSTAAPLTTAGATPGSVLATWKQLLDDGAMQAGDKHLAATARPAVARVPRTVLDALGPVVTLTGDRGSVTLPAEAADLPDGVVWVPTRSSGRGVLADLASPGARVTVKGAEL